MIFRQKLDHPKFQAALILKRSPDIFRFFPAGGLHLCLEAKTKQKIQDCFCPFLCVFIKPKFGRVISSIPRSFPLSLRFHFNSRATIKRGRPLMQRQPHRSLEFSILFGLSPKSKIRLIGQKHILMASVLIRS